jgi:enoyl-CoA hydratase
MHRLHQPIIAAVNGPATGGGLALVLGSDIRIASASERFSAAFIRIGLSACDIGTSWSLPRIVGAGRAHELMLTGRIIDASEAERIGLVIEVVADQALVARVLREADLIMLNTPMGVHMTKEVMWSALEIPGQQAAIDLENRTQLLVAQTADQTEGATAFLQRRPPRYEDH